MGAIVTLPDEMVQFVDQRQAKELLGPHYDEIDFLTNSNFGLYPLHRIRKAVNKHNKKAKAKAAEAARLASLPQTPPVCIPTKTTRGKAGQMIPVTDPRIQFIGRGLIGETIKCSLPSSTIRFYVQGPASKVGISAYSPKEYRASKISTNEGTFGSLVNVWVNGFRKGRFGVHAGSKAKQYIVAEDLPKGVTIIDIVKGTEAGMDLLVFKGVHLPEGATLAELPQEPRKVIEFIGDSDVSGWGSVGPPRAMDAAYTARRMAYFSDPDKSFARLVSKCFDADVVNLGVSGSGIVAAGATVTDSEGNKHTGAPASAVYAHQICFNWGEDVPAVEDVDGEDGEDVAGEDVVVVGEEFANVSKYTADTVPRADLVVVWIGQTDVLRGEIAIEDVSTGTEQYTKLLGKVRELRPETPILCLYPEEVIHSSHPASRTLLVDSGVAAAGFEPDSAYARQKAIHGDESYIQAWARGAAKNLGGESQKIFVRGVTMTPFFDPKTDYGAFYELSAHGQKKLARGVVPHVQAITKWPIVAELKA